MALSRSPGDADVGIDDHLPPVHSDELRARRCVGASASRRHWRPEIVTEHRILQREPAPANVLVPLVERHGGDVTVLLTQRTDHLADHPGQVSFPGGRAEPSDADAAATALREAREEIGLTEAHVDVLGALPIYTTGTGFVVTPVVALVRPDFELQLDPFEVAETFEVPLAFLADPANHRRHEVEFAGARREFLSMPCRVHDATRAGRGAISFWARRRRCCATSTGSSRPDPPDRRGAVRGHR